MALLGRIILVIVAFIIAAICALSVLLFLTSSLLEEIVMERPPEYVDPGIVADYFAILILLGYGALIASAVTIVAVAIGEIANIRSWIYYVLTAGGAFAATPVLAVYPAEFAAVPDTELITMCASAGFVGGFVYWLLAGRSA